MTTPSTSCPSAFRDHELTLAFYWDDDWKIFPFSPRAAHLSQSQPFSPDLPILHPAFSVATALSIDVTSISDQSRGPSTYYQQDLLATVTSGATRKRIAGYITFTRNLVPATSVLSPRVSLQSIGPICPEILKQAFLVPPDQQVFFLRHLLTRWWQTRAIVDIRRRMRTWTLSESG